MTAGEEACSSVEVMTLMGEQECPHVDEAARARRGWLCSRERERESRESARRAIPGCRDREEVWLVSKVE